MDDRPVARRRFLAAVGVVAAGLAAGCTDDDETRRVTPTPTPTTAPPPDPTTTSTPQTVDRDTALVAAVRRDEQRLVATYRAASQRHPQLRPDVEVLQAHHVAHLEVLGAGAAGAREPARGRSARQAVLDLRRRERQAVSDRRRDALAAGSGELARVLAAMAASSAQHVVVLDGLARPARRGGR